MEWVERQTEGNPWAASSTPLPPSLTQLNWSKICSSFMLCGVCVCERDRDSGPAWYLFIGAALTTSVQRTLYFSLYMCRFLWLDRRQFDEFQGVCVYIYLSLFEHTCTFFFLHSLLSFSFLPYHPFIIIPQFHLFHSHLHFSLSFLTFLSFLFLSVFLL